jgi:HemY protein
MLRLLLFFLVLTLAVALGLLLKKDPGYLMVAYHHWVIEMPLWAGFVAILLFYFLLSLLFKLIHFTELLPERLQKYFHTQRRIRAENLSKQGFIELTQGNWKSAEKKFKSSIKNNNHNISYYLAAAEAANAEKKIQIRDNYLQQAADKFPEAKNALLLKKFQYQMIDQDWQAALDNLSWLKKFAPQHPYIFQLLVKVYLKLNDWLALYNLIPDLQRYDVYDKKDFEDLEISIYRQLILEKSKLGEATDFWEKLPRKYRKNPLLVEAYIPYLISKNNNQEAINLIDNTLRNDWNEILVEWFGKIPADNLNKQFQTAENWARIHPSDSMLYLTLGRVALLNELWGKAKIYFEKSVELKPSAAGFLELGKLAESQNKLVEAKNYFERGLMITGV